MQKTLLRNAADFEKVANVNFYGETNYEREEAPTSYPAIAVEEEHYAGDSDYTMRTIIFVYPSEFEPNA